MDSEVSERKRVALVTGSSSGIGLACAHTLAKRGVNIIVTGSRDATLVQDTLHELRSHGVQVDYISADLRDLKNVDKLWSEVIGLYPDGIDILINNAGFACAAPIEDITDENWNQSMTLNVSVAFQLIKRSLPAMKQKGWGRIINISSTYGVVGGVQAGAYIASKFALVGLTKGVALETASHGITCNAVCPGYCATPLMLENNQKIASNYGLSFDDYLKNMLLKQVPTGQLITMEQIAELVEFLSLSKASSQMTGASYVIDGGYTAQ